MANPTTDQTKNIKIAVAGVCLLVAAVLLANTFGVITLWGGLPAQPPQTAEQIKAAEDAIEVEKERLDELKKAGAVPVGG